MPAAARRVRTAWRIVKRKYAADAFDGEGARRFGGRWNSKGASVVYAAGSESLAILEVYVHLDEDSILEAYALCKVEFDSSLIEVAGLTQLPSGWRNGSPPSGTQRFGDEWIRNGASVILAVPSVIVPAESNYLINPRHPDFARLRIGQPEPYTFGSRLVKKVLKKDN